MTPFTVFVLMLLLGMLIVRLSYIHNFGLNILRVYHQLLWNLFFNYCMPWLLTSTENGRPVFLTRHSVLVPELFPSAPPSSIKHKHIQNLIRSFASCFNVCNCRSQIVLFGLNTTSGQFKDQTRPDLLSTAVEGRFFTWPNLLEIASYSDQCNRPNPATVAELLLCRHHLTKLVLLLLFLLLFLFLHLLPFFSSLGRRSLFVSTIICTSVFFF